MKTHSPLLLSAVLLFSGIPLAGPSGSALAQATDADAKSKADAAITRGLEFLTKKQDAAGFWSSADYPGLTALVVQAYILAPGGAHRKDEAVTKGIEFIRQKAQKDGSIHSGRYYHLMSKGLTAAGVKTLKTKDGKTVDWRAELTAKLLSLQKPDGSWSSPNVRWMEKDSNLVTTYCLLALAQLAEGK